MFKACNSCGESKLESAFYWDARRNTTRKVCVKCFLAKITERKRTLLSTPEGRGKIHALRRRHKLAYRVSLVEKGKTTKNTARVFTPERVAMQAQRNAEAATLREATRTWRTYLRFIASDEWLRTYYAAMGKPWLNPRVRLSDGERWSLRYEHDPAFRVSEFARLKKFKRERARLMRTFTDGTLTRDVMRALWDSAAECPYCKVALHENNKSLDHTIPLNPGLHSINNVRVCCRSCNSRKGRKSLDEFVATMSLH